MKPEFIQTDSLTRPGGELVIKLRTIEKFFMALFLLLIVTILVVSGWSAALVMLGYEDGGGPIGAVVNLLS